MANIYTTDGASSPSLSLSGFTLITDGLNGELREYTPVPRLGAFAAWRQARRLRRRTAKRQPH